MVRAIVFVGILAAGAYIAMGKEWQDRFWSKGSPLPGTNV